MSSDERPALLRIREAVKHRTASPAADRQLGRFERGPAIANRPEAAAHAAAATVKRLLRGRSGSA